MFIKKKKINKKEVELIKKKFLSFLKSEIIRTNLVDSFIEFKKKKWLINFFITILMILKKYFKYEYDEIIKNVLNEKVVEQIIKYINDDWQKIENIKIDNIDEYIGNYAFDINLYKNLLNGVLIPVQIIDTNENIKNEMILKNEIIKLFIYFFTNNYLNVKFDKDPIENLNNNYEEKVLIATYHCEQIETIFSNLRKILKNDFNEITNFINYSSKKMI